MQVKRLLLLVAGLLLAVGAVLGLETWLRDREAGKGLVPYPTERLGYLVQHPESDSGVPGDIVVLGDSLTDGGGLPRVEAWPGVAAELLGRDVFNLSSVGWDVGHVAAAAHDLAPELSPRLLVYAAFTNDGTPTRLIGDPPVFVGIGAPPGLEWASPWLPRSAIVRYFVGSSFARASLDGRVFDDDDFFERRFEELAEVEHELLVFVLVPHVFGANEPGGNETYASHYWSAQAIEHQRILDAAERAGVPAASVFPYLVESGRQDFMREHLQDRVHPDAAGQALFAEAFVDILGRHERGEPFRTAPFEGSEAPPRPHRPGGGKGKR